MMSVIDMVLKHENTENRIMKYIKLVLVIKIYGNSRKIKLITHHHWRKNKILLFHAIMIPTYFMIIAWNKLTTKIITIILLLKYSIVSNIFILYTDPAYVSTL